MRGCLRINTTDRYNTEQQMPQVVRVNGKEKHKSENIMLIFVKFMIENRMTQ